MAIPNVSALSPNSRLSSSPLQLSTHYLSRLCSNEFNMPCSFMNNSGPFRHQTRPFSKQCNAVSAISSGGRGVFWCKPDHHLPSLRSNAGAEVILHGRTRSHSWRPSQVKSGDSEGTLSSEGIVLDEQTLERDLQIAIKEEDYAQAAKIRDSLRLLHEDSRASVLAANARFYNSFRTGDLATMQSLWAKGEHVCCVHPGVSGISGYDLVMGSWEFVWADYEFPLEIELKNVQVHVRGDVGYVTCTEVVKTKGSNWGKQFATNVFERIDGRWFICIHHASHIDL
ncbi:PREDICTED: uncharacterized protein LOC104601157 isoform X2 [Nelumbo nucifera]|uniref:Uncharacterized protein LOC104601157 isoform X2 n=1 Tax=Nelumbo nucifera TaxID=4432 RepID=A0A1U8A7X3_NELNU|nr:PREDICTED: uncharacterized protein LOC104601157 isoform X2 [Nelumbo nucifera]